MINDKANEVIKKLFKLLLNRYQIQHILNMNNDT